jgi:hypothetical protein
VIPKSIQFAKLREAIVISSLAWGILLAGSGCGRAGTTYYVSPAGNDGNSGTAAARAWKSIERANGHRFRPGDRLLFEGGGTFVGNLLLDAEDAGSAGMPVTVGSYGSGRATIRAGLGYAVLVRNAGNVDVRDLICVGDDRTTNHGAGVAFINSLPGNARLRDVHISNVDARGFGRELAAIGAYPEGHQLPQGAGILVAGYASDRSKSGYDGVEITGCTAHDNSYFGILITGYWSDRPARYANSKVHIADCRVYENPGDPLYHENHSGSGILVEDCDGGLVERCVAFENGALCDGAPGGPCGIWTASSNRVTIQHCESYANRTGTAPDGDGFDLDGGCTACVLQYNYSHDNDGAGILVYTYANAPHTDRGNVVRWNICENDSVKRRSYGAIMVGNDGDGMSGVEIYQNTFVTNRPADAVVNIHGKDVGAALRNNVLLSTAGIPLVRTDGAAGGLVFQGNLYWTTSRQFALIGTQGLRSLAEWRAAGMENIEGHPTGGFADPGLSLNASRGTPGDLSRLVKFAAFRPPAGSPALRCPLDLGTVQIDTGSQDFHGNRLRTNLRASGACAPLD